MISSTGSGITQCTEIGTIEKQQLFLRPAMSDTIYCYHCRTRHPKEEMRQVESKGIKRWRCKKSILGARKSAAERAAYGQEITNANRELARTRAKLKSLATDECTYQGA